MLADEYLGRIPYLPWVLLAPICGGRDLAPCHYFQDDTNRRQYATTISCRYRDDPEFDGYVIIVENGRIFNLMLFRGSYADTTLRRKQFWYI